MTAVAPSTTGQSWLGHRGVTPSSWTSGVRLHEDERARRAEERGERGLQIRPVRRRIVATMSARRMGFSRKKSAPAVRAASRGAGAAGGDGDDRQRLELLVGADGGDDLGAVEDRQVDVDDQDVEAVRS